MIFEWTFKYEWNEFEFYEKIVLSQLGNLVTAVRKYVTVFRNLSGVVRNLKTSVRNHTAAVGNSNNVCNVLDLKKNI